MVKKVEVSGDMIVGDSRSKWVKPYSLEIEVPDGLENDGVIRSLARKVIVPDLLRKQEEMFRRIRTLQIDSVKDVKEAKGSEKKFSELEEKMAEAANKGCVPDNLESYGSDKTKLEALGRAIDKADKEKAGKSRKKQGGVTEQDEGYID